MLEHPSTNTPVFFVSGAFQSMGSWKKFAEHFAQSTTVILCDLPGTGSSEVLPYQFGLDFLARRWPKSCANSGSRRVHVVAASYGSPIAYRFAQLYPEAVDRLVLGGVMKEIPGPSRVHRPDPGLVARAADDGLRAGGRGRPSLLDPDKSVERRALARRLLIGQLERMSPADGERYIHNTMRLLTQPPLDLRKAPPVPALVFTGEHDVYTRPEHCRGDRRGV